MDTSFLPHVNACLNAASAVLLTIGFVTIRAKNQAVHRRFMEAALLVSAVFLVSYITYHFTAKITKFEGQGVVRPVYFAILISHTVLAVTVPPLAILAYIRARRGRFEAHKKIARIALPIWLYVSVTGVVVYWMLYHAYPAAVSPS
jgi:uncharacterized membrane protein YozB (DUF420 family)